MKSISTFFITLLLMFSLCSTAQVVYLKGVLQGTQEEPANGSAATGVAIAKYDMATKVLELWGNYSGLSDTIIASHIHLGAPGVSGPVIVAITNSGNTAGSLRLTSTLAADVESSLLAGNVYVNVHSKTIPGGEIRAQLSLATQSSTSMYTGRFQGAQEAPPNASRATGMVRVLLDEATGDFFVTGTFRGLAANASMAHIHRGPLGVSGPVIVTLNVTPDTSGSISAYGVVSASFIDSLKNGNTYANIHNSSYPGGEIRAQLNNLSQVRFFKAVLQGSQEVPSNASTATGVVIVKYNPNDMSLMLTGDYQGLNANASMAHIHSPASPGSTAGVVVTLNQTGGTSGVLSVSSTISSDLEQQIMDGLAYVNVHNVNFPGGEIRGQLTPAAAGEAAYFEGTLEGTQEVPSNNTAARGHVSMLLDRTTREVFVTGNFEGLESAATMAHIHRGEAKVAGPVVFGLNVTKATSGTINGTSVVSQIIADSILAGMSYANIHNANYTGGQIRAQLADLVLPVKLQYFNGYKKNEQVALIWKSQLEENVRQYEVQQQVGNSWQTKLIVASKPTTFSPEFSVLDKPTSGSGRYVFYRLKIVDIDGKITYSPVVKLNFDKVQAELALMGNPVNNGLLRFNISGVENNQPAEAVVLDLNGRTMLKGRVATLASATLNVRQLSTGIYRLVVRFGSTVLQQSFVK